MSEVFEVRILDALQADPSPAIRNHDGERLLDRTRRDYPTSTPATANS
jgi:hypothetical protein